MVPVYACRSNRRLFAGNRFRGKQHVTVIHVHALHDLVVHKQQELRVFAVVTLVDLRAHIQPQCLAVKRSPAR